MTGIPANTKRMEQKIAIWEAAKSLVRENNLSAIPRLRKILTHSKDTEQRAAAAHALGGLHDQRAVHPLISTLKNRRERPKVRGMAAEALGDLSKRLDTTVETALIAALSDPSSEVRFWSAFALGSVRSRKAIPILRHLAKTDRGEIRGWSSVAKEVSDAIRRIEKPLNSHRTPMKRTLTNSSKKRSA
jgi:HEAT repeat protein